MEFSIIIPIYNVDNYLKKSIESVLTQNHQNYELILVNDGSTDESGDICDIFASEDNRIKVIHKKNGGLSSARNSGLNIAKNENIIFLDGDDYLTTGILQKISSYKITDIDLITCSMNIVRPNKPIEYNSMELSPLNKKNSRKKLYQELVKSSVVYWSASSNIYKKSIIRENNLYFEKNLIGAEDCEFTMEYIRNSSDFMFIDQPLINYRKERIGSITTEMSGEAVQGQLKVFNDNYNIYKENSIMQTYFANKFANAIFLLSAIDSPTQKKRCIDYIHTNKKILKSTKGLKYTFAKILWSFLGFEKGSAFLKTMKNVNKNND